MWSYDHQKFPIFTGKQKTIKCVHDCFLRLLNENHNYLLNSWTSGSLDLLLLTCSAVSFLFKILATAWPTCDVYLQQQGNDFIIDRGNIILKSNQKQSVPADEWSEVSPLLVAVVCRAVNRSPRWLTDHRARPTEALSQSKVILSSRAERRKEEASSK